MGGMAKRSAAMPRQDMLPLVRSAVGGLARASLARRLKPFSPFKPLNSSTPDPFPSPYEEAARTNQYRDSHGADYKPRNRAILGALCSSYGQCTMALRSLIETVTILGRDL